MMVTTPGLSCSAMASSSSCLLPMLYALVYMHFSSAADFTQLWLITLRVLTGEPGFISFPLQTWFKGLLISPANSWARIILPLLDRWTLFHSSRPGAVKVAPWSKHPKFHWWHQPLSHSLIKSVFLFLSSFIPATEGTEQNTTCPPVPSTNQPRPLKFF